MQRSFLDYCASFLEFAGRRAGIAFALVFVGALLDGVGLVMLVPVLELFAGNTQSSYSKWAVEFLSGIGITTREGQLLFALASFLGLLFLRNFIGWLRDTRIMALSHGFVDQWRANLFRAIARAPWSKVMSYHRTDLEHAITSDVSRLSVGTDKILRGSIVLVMMAIQITIALILSLPLTLIVLLFIGFAGLFLYPLILRARKLGEFLTKTGRSMHSILGQFMAGLKLAKAHDAEQNYVMRFTNSMTDLRSVSLKYSSDQILSRALFQAASGMVVCLVIVVGVFLLNTPVPVLVVVLIIMGRLTGPFMTLVQSAQSFANMLPAFRSLQQTQVDLLDGRLPGEERKASPVERVREQPARVELQNICFIHSGQKEGGLVDVSLDLKPGSITALVGPSGAGKTTIVDIVSGLLTPASGKLLIDGEVVSKSTTESVWGSGLAYVPQDPFLFDVSLRENLLWPGLTENSGIDDSALWEALELAGAADFVRQTPGQLDARAGERGQAFSGGERQRLCLARALIHQPRLLILDEATNAIDMALENEVLQRLEALRGLMSILIITHRHASIESADQVWEIENGRVKQWSGASKAHKKPK